METRLNQILKKISLSKVIDMRYIIWHTSIDNKTLNSLNKQGYSVAECGVNINYYYISW